jgi:hypothetical protein
MQARWSDLPCRYCRRIDRPFDIQINRAEEYSRDEKPQKEFPYEKDFCVGQLLRLGCYSGRIRAPTGIVAASRPRPPTTPGAKPACDANRAIHVSGTAMINAAPDAAPAAMGVHQQHDGLKGRQRATIPVPCSV